MSLDHRSASDQLAKAMMGLASGTRAAADGALTAPELVATINDAIAAVAVDDPVLRLEAELDPGAPAGVALVCSAAPDIRFPFARSITFDSSRDPVVWVRDALALALEWPAPRDQSIPSLPATQGVDLPRDSQVADLLQRDGVVTLVGVSASGKTYTAAHVATNLEAFGWTVSFTDIGNPACGLDLLFLQLILTPRNNASKHLFIIDNVQGNPGLARACLAAVSRLSSNQPDMWASLILTWPSGLQIVRESFLASRVIPCDGDEVLNTLTKSLARRDDDDIVNNIRALSGGDALIGHLAVDYYHVNGSLPGASELADVAFHEITHDEPLSDQAIALLYEIAVLGQFEVDVAANYAARNDPEALSELVSLGVVRNYGSFVTIGHRTLAALVAAYAGSHIGKVAGPVQIVVNYLKAAGEAQLVATLERLDLAKLSSSTRDQHGSAFLANAWQSARVLTRYTSHQTRADPTWGNNAASAIFAGEPLARFDVGAWELIAEFVRTSWTVTPDCLPAPATKLTTERIDFDEIAKRMAEEDKRNTAGAYEMTADQIDLDRTHRTWMLGLLLGFEANAPVRQSARIAELVACASSIQDADGWFYPPRIPWVTARVLLGLAAAGESVHTSATVKAACDWLRTPAPSGPSQFGVWDSGTGTWNTTAVTSAMCLLALVRCGVALDDPTVKTAHSFLLAKRDAWLEVGREMDAAEALQVLLLSGDNWRTVQDDLGRLLHWARDREAWSTALHSAADVQDESCKVPQIAGSMVRLVWAILNTDISLLVEGVATEMSNRLLRGATA
jgi:hypothetical protein